MVIIDEVHNIKRIDGKIYNSIFKLVKNSGKRLLLTATPFVNNINDFSNLINLIHADSILGTSRDVKENKVISNLSNKNIDEIFNIYLKNNIHYLKILDSNYPRVYENKYSVNMTKNYEDQYITLVQGYMINDIQFSSPQVFYHAYRKAVNKINAKLNNIEENDFTMKLNSILDLIKLNGKTVIYTNWITFGIEPIMKFLENNDISYRSFYGQTDADTRAEIIKEYNENKFKVLIITKAGGEGINLMETKNIVIMDPTWNDATLTQIKSRAIRYSSHSNLPDEDKFVNVLYLVLKTNSETIRSGDEILYNIIENKKNKEHNIIDMMKNMSI